MDNLEINPTTGEEETGKKNGFKINRNIIQSIDRDEQAIELQNLDVAVYDQSTFELGVISQVNKVLQDDSKDELEEGELIGEDLNSTDTHCDASNDSIQSNQSNGDIIQKREKDSTLKELEKYLKNQLELQKKRKQQVSNPTNQVKKRDNGDLSPGPKAKKVAKVAGGKGPKRTTETAGSEPQKKRKKKREKELAGTKITASYKCKGEKPTSQPGETNYIYLNEESGSEYVPTDTESEGDEEQYVKPKKNKSAEKKTKTQNNKTPTNRRPKKEMDDGDIDIYHNRLKEWAGEDSGFHDLACNFRVPCSVWEKLYPYQQEGVQWLLDQDETGHGGIVGDEMGLGKTVQTVVFLAGLHWANRLRPCLVVCPTTVMHQWVREFHQWLPPVRVAILHESGNFPDKERQKLVGIICRRGSGVIVTSYSGLVQHKEAILCRQWHYVILDEGHKIRNPTAKVTLVAKELDTPHRLILSGSPLQNNLRELWSLVDFIFPGRLGSLDTFITRFAAPITQGGYANASQAQVLAGYKCAVLLRDLVTPQLLRRTKAEVGESARLPGKTEQILFCKLSSIQKSLYNSFVSSLNLGDLAHGSKRLFSALSHLRKLCNHPDLFTPPEKVGTEAEQKFGYHRRAGKMIVVETLLRIWKQQGHRVLLFSQGIKMLNIIESFVQSKGYRYLRLDGGTSISARQPLIDKFNKDSDIYLMLLTTKVGGLGVNLTGANRVVIYDPDWNPATDTQARERAWRIGQSKQVTIYRLVTAATIEEKIYHRQIYKQFLSNRVLKDPKQRRFFKSNDLMELFSPTDITDGGMVETAAIFAGTSSEVKLKDCGRFSPRDSAEIPTVSFSQSKIEAMKKFAQALSKKITCQNKLGKGTNASAEEGKGTNASAEEGKGTNASAEEAKGTNASAEEGKGTKASAEEIHASSQEKKEQDDKDSSSNQEMLTKITRTIDVKDINGSQIKKTESDCSANPEDKGQNNDRNETDRYTTVYGPDGNLLPFVEENNNKPGPSNYGANKMFKDKGVDKENKFVIDGKEDKSKRGEEKKKKKNWNKSGGEFIEFEGEIVPHLVGCKKMKRKRREEPLPFDQSQDDYVLHKLFSKTGIETAMKHDNIIEGGPSDYAIVEAEAEQVARDALKALRESRTAEPPVPFSTFNIDLGSFMKQDKTSNVSDGFKIGGGSSDSNILLDRLKNKYITTKAESGERGLLREVIAWLCSQGGTASTNKLVAEFSKKVGEGKSPLFRSFLGNIATFYRAPDGIGYWTIKDEFK